MFEAVFFQAPGDWLSAISLGIFGLLIGSFLNVVIHRYPRIIERETENAIAEHLNQPLPHQDKYNLVVPRSACPHCGHQITAMENIPVISYLFLRGKCRACNASISFRYPLIELISGLATAGLIWLLGSGLTGILTLIALYLIICLLSIKMDSGEYPDELIWALLWTGLILNARSVICTPVSAIVAAVITYLLFKLTGFITRLVSNKNRINDSYCVLFAAIGAWTGLPAQPLYAWWLKLNATETLHTLLHSMMLDTLLFQPAGDMLSSASLGIFGLLVGSFLNVVIYRSPRMIARQIDNAIAYHRHESMPHHDRYNLLTPRSACPHCEHKISALENIPVLSYLVLGGKCRACKAPISARYPFVELITGLYTAGLIWLLGSGLAGLTAVLFTYFLITLTLIDADVQLLPDSLTLTLMWIGLLLNSQSILTQPSDAIYGAVAGYISLWLVNFFYKLWRNQDGFGGGDFKMLAALGAWMGWKMLPLIILLSSATGSVIGITLILMSRMGFSTRLSFGPYLAFAGLIALLWGEKIVSAYLGVLH